jgi:hypothetical protein
MEKKFVLGLIKKMYPESDHILIDIPGNTILARCTNDPSKNKSRPIDAESKYLPMLAEAYEIENIQKIEIDLISKKVTFIGNTTKVI